jgi:hypothetical protein
MGWIGVVEAVVGAIVLLVLVGAFFALRRRWLGHAAAVFECSLRIRTTTPSAGWALGVARYSGENIEWFRLFSFVLTPRIVFRRDSLRVLEHRVPDAVEAVSLYEDQIVVRVESATSDPPRQWDLAMPGDSLTGMLAWLEAAPPGRPY